jgi:hypothetical protein
MATCAIARYYSIMARSAETCHRRASGAPNWHAEKRPRFFSQFYTNPLRCLTPRFRVEHRTKDDCPFIFLRTHFGGSPSPSGTPQFFYEFHSSRRVTATLITPSTNTKFFERYVFQDRFQIFFGLTAVSLILDDFSPGLERRLIRHMNGIKKETNQKIENLDRKIENLDRKIENVEGSLNVLDWKIKNVEGSLNAKIANVELNLNTKMSRLELNLNTEMSNLNTKISRLELNLNTEMSNLNTEMSNLNTKMSNLN